MATADGPAISAGALARERSIDLAACPYPDARIARFWRLGWRIRDRALRRWERQADQMEQTLARAAPFLDRLPTSAGQVPLSKLVAIHFYKVGSREPDAAWTWFQQTIEAARADYRAARRAAAELGTPRDAGTAK